MIEAGNVRLESGWTEEERKSARAINLERKIAGKAEFRDYWNVIFVDEPSPQYEKSEGESTRPYTSKGEHKVTSHWRVYRYNRDGAPRDRPLVIFIPAHKRGKGPLKTRTIWTLAKDYKKIR